MFIQLAVFLLNVGDSLEVLATSLFSYGRKGFFGLVGSVVSVLVVFFNGFEIFALFSLDVSSSGVTLTLGAVLVCVVFFGIVSFGSAGV
jgi:hypothetical protein